MLVSEAGPGACSTMRSNATAVSTEPIPFFAGLLSLVVMAVPNLSVYLMILNVLNLLK
jgi:hypothetical protein